jgi:hypothetical protein
MEQVLKFLSHLHPRIPPLDRGKELFTFFGLKKFKAQLPAHKQQFIELQNTS